MVREGEGEGEGGGREGREGGEGRGEREGRGMGKEGVGRDDNKSIKMKGKERNLGRSGASSVICYTKQKKSKIYTKKISKIKYIKRQG